MSHSLSLSAPLLTLYLIHCVHTQPVDLWGFGILIYWMVMHDVPFKAKPQKQMTAKDIEGTEINWRNIPIKKNGIALLQNLLQKDANKREWNVLETNQWLVSRLKAIDEDDM